MTNTEFVHQEVIRVLNTVTQLRTVIPGVVPPPSAIRHYPTVAIDFAEIRRKPSSVTRAMDVEEEIDIYLFNQQPSSSMEDISTPLIQEIDSVLQNDQVLQDSVIEGYISHIVSDGGVLHPQGGRTLHRLTFYLRYIERCVN